MLKTQPPALTALLAAFPASPMTDVAALVYRPDDHDAQAFGEMVRDRTWLDLADEEVAREAWSLPWTSDVGFLALLPAYVRAALRSGHDDVVAALRRELDPDTNRDRLGRLVPRLSPAQRAAVLGWVALVEAEESSVLHYWRRVVERPDAPPWNEPASRALQAQVVGAFPALPFADAALLLVGIEGAARLERARRALESKTWRELRHLDVALHELASPAGLAALLPFALHTALEPGGPSASVLADLSPAGARAALLAELASSLTPAQLRTVRDFVRLCCEARHHDGSALAFWDEALAASAPATGLSSE